MGLRINEGPEWKDDPLGYVNKELLILNLTECTLVDKVYGYKSKDLPWLPLYKEPL